MEGPKSMARTPVPRVFHPVAQTTEAHIRYTIFGKKCENVLAFRWDTTTPPSIALLVLLATELYSVLVRKYQLFTHPLVSFTEIYVRNVDTEVANEATYTIPVNTIGTASGSPLSNQDSYSLVKRTGQTGRSRHGGIRFSGLTSNEIQSNVVLNALFTALANLVLSLLADRVGGVFHPALASRKLGQSYLLAAYVGPDALVDTTDNRRLDG